jgi:MFS family permease
MENKEFKLYPYRWVVLAVFMFINLTIQILWVAYSPIAATASQFYNVSPEAVNLFAMTFMIAFIPLSIPVSWAIDKYGFYKTVGLGAILMAVCGIARGLTGNNYTLTLIATIGIAIAQPFLLNAWTTVPAKWFNVDFRATAVGLITLSNLVGTALGGVLSPMLVDEMGLSIPTVQLIYGVITAFSSVLFLIFAREKPATPPCPAGMEVRSLMVEGLKNALKNRMFWFYLVVFFIGMGIFNGVITLVDMIMSPRGFTSAVNGTVIALMLVGGLIGALVIPPFSDKYHKRKGFLLFGVLAAIPGMIGVTFATSEILLYVSSFAMGFFLTSINPIGMQYVAEITWPTPEGTSNGLIQLFGQASVVFVYLMQVMKDGSGTLTPAMLLGIGLLAVGAILLTQLKDPDIFKKAE